MKRNRNSAVAKNKTLGRFARNLSARILMKFVFTSIAYAAVLALLFFLAYIFYDVIGRQIYVFQRLAQTFSGLTSYIQLIFIFCLVFGILVIFVVYWVKTLGYLQEIAGAAKSIYTEQEKPVELPADLDEVEKQMNVIREQVLASRRAAKDEEQRKNDLIVYLAHDLKTPLTSVIGYLDLLKSESELPPALRQKYLNVAYSKAERLEELINEFFEITRFNLASIPLDRNAIDLTRMLEQVVFEFQPMLREKGLTCTLHAPEKLPLSCDADKLSRVLDNLLKNAVHYSFPNSEITISASEVAGVVRLVFQNHGQTIAPEQLSRIFEQFYRLDAARSTQGGSGVGLAIAKRIVEAHGGTITAESADNLVTFTVFLPRA